MNEIYFKTELSYPDLANHLRDILKIPYEERESLNLGGGEYYLFKTKEWEFYLIRNEGEVEIPEREGWSYYLYAESLNGNVGEEAVDAYTHELARTLKENGLDVEVDELRY